MFRPDENMKRFNTSLARLGLQEFEDDELLKCIEKLLILDKEYIPDRTGASLYIRPFGMALDNKLSVGPSSSTRISVILSPVGSYFGDVIRPIHLGIYRGYERGNPKSAAGYKLASNYAPTVKPSSEYLKRGIDQILWVHDEKILEVGACNIFFMIKGKDGVIGIVTPPLDGSVLPGITRKSLIQIINKETEYEAKEADITVKDLTTAFDEDRVVEIFGTGTAATCIPVASLGKNQK